MIKNTQNLFIIVNIFFFVFSVNASIDNKLYNQALDLQQKREYHKAINNFNMIIIEDPDSILIDSCYYMLGDCYKNLRDFDKALDSFKNITEKYKESEYYSDSFFMIGFILYKKGDYSKAKEQLTDFIKKFPDSPLISEAQEKIRGCSDQDFDSAKEEMLYLPSGLSNSLELLRKGMPARALDRLANVKTNIWNEELLLLRIICYRELKEYSKMENSIKSFYRKFSSSKWTPICEDFIKKTDNRTKEKNRILLAGNGNPEKSLKYYIELIDGYVKGGEYSRAIEAITKSGMGKNTIIAEYRACLYFQLGMVKRAEESLNKVAEMNTDIAMYLGYINYSKNDLKKASLFYNKAENIADDLKSKNNIKRALSVIK